MRLRLSCSLAGVLWILSVAAPASRAVQFDRDILPLFAEYCFKCHGPDKSRREGELRLDRGRDAATQVVAGSRSRSKLFQRVSATDPDQRMPPPSEQKPLSEAQIELLGQWLDEGAPWSKHWSYVPPRRPAVPQVSNSSWPQSPLDHFILARLEENGYQPSERAEWFRLLRRVSFDLTGFPPTPAELQRFQSEASTFHDQAAFTKYVDRLLASPRYGEHMAVFWLDAARYADTHGYHADTQRDMWRWRDWVIDALNQNMPFDQFTLEQLAGDLLPNATLDQVIATGFNRNHMINFEDGTIPEEFRTEYVVDRVTTTATVWLGQTAQCARCHDHKYDPLTQRDFYQLYAFFNNVPEQGLDGRDGNAVPFVDAPTPLQVYQIQRLEQQACRLRDQIEMQIAAAAPRQRAWEQDLIRGGGPTLQPLADAILHHPLDVDEPGRIVGTAQWLPGKFGKALLFGGSTFVEIDDVAAFDHTDPFSFGAWVFPTTRDRAAVLSRMDDQQRGYSLLLDDGSLHVQIAHAEDAALRVKAASKMPLRSWQHVLVTYDSSGRASGVHMFVNGQEQAIIVEQDNLAGSIRTDQPLRIGQRHSDAAFRGMIDDVRLFDRQLSAAEAGLLSGSNPLHEIARIPIDQRSQPQRELLQTYYLRTHDARYVALQRQLRRVEQELREFPSRISTTMIMREMETPRETFVLRRGDYRFPTERVQADVPAFLPSLPAGAPRNRLGLARWLVDPGNPLTARVTVNRMWQHFFGAGLVATPEDFGTRGAQPSHPDLLDWLATEFMRSGWNVKYMHRLIVTSATYQQASRQPPVHPPSPRSQEIAALYGRFPRQPLHAEAIRDSVLLVSGLLDGRLGGKSVFPYQPPGLWSDVAYATEYSAQTYLPSIGGDRYRRSLYTFWKRSVPAPAQEILNAPNRETCTVRRATNSTSLQALVLMNEPTFIEASCRLAKSVTATAGSCFDEQLRFTFERLFARLPAKSETAILKQLWEENWKEYRQDPAAAASLLEFGKVTPGSAPVDAEQAAWASLIQTLFTLDEFVMKQ